jgi:D-alanine transaminase
MDTAYFNGSFLPKNEIRISPDDRGFLFGDGVYEVMKWYGNFFYDLEGHHTRLKRSLREVLINWSDADSFPSFARELIGINHLKGKQAMIYLQVTRGEAPRNHAFPDPEVQPTVYAFVREINPAKTESITGIKVLTGRDIRWCRCDIKSVSLLANTLCFQEARNRGMMEYIFVRDGVITEGSRSNIFFVADGILRTYPESQYILSGITRKNAIRLAKESGIKVIEEPIAEKDLGNISEAFITNSSAEVTPVTAFGTLNIGDGTPGPITKQIHKKFRDEITALEG